MSSGDEIVQTLIDEIERYLSAHPNAADTVEGIRGWWLPPELRMEPLERVISALGYLERRGFVAKAKLEGDAEIYSAAARH